MQILAFYTNSSPARGAETHTVLVEGKAQVSRGRNITVERAWLEYLGRESGAAFGAGGKWKNLYLEPYLYALAQTTASGTLLPRQCLGHT